MRTLLRLRRAAALLIGCTVLPWLATAGAAHPPIYKDAERAGPARHPSPHAPGVIVEVDQVCCTAAPGYHRPVNRGPGYVGSVRGLGRPSYDGLWPPPGYGSYREHPLD